MGTTEINYIKGLKIMTGMNCSFECKVIGTPKIGTTRSGKQQVTFTGVYEDFTGETKICLVNAYGPAAITAAKTLKTEQQVHVEGALLMNTWEKNGEQKSGLSVNANHIQLLNLTDKQEDLAFS